MMVEMKLRVRLNFRPSNSKFHSLPRSDSRPRARCRDTSRPLPAFPETAHVGIHCAGIDEIVVFPDILERLVAGSNAAAPLSQDREELELGGGKVDGLSFHYRLVPGDIDREFFPLDAVGFLGGDFIAAQEALDPEDQFTGAEWFGDVVIRS